MKKPRTVHHLVMIKDKPNGNSLWKSGCGLAWRTQTEKPPLAVTGLVNVTCKNCLKKGAT